MNSTLDQCLTIMISFNHLSIIFLAISLNYESLHAISVRKYTAKTVPESFLVETFTYTDKVSTSSPLACESKAFHSRKIAFKSDRNKCQVGNIDGNSGDINGDNLIKIMVRGKMGKT